MISKKGTKTMRSMRKKYGPIKGGSIKQIDHGFYGHVLPGSFQETHIIQTNVRN